MGAALSALSTFAHASTLLFLLIGVACGLLVGLLPGLGGTAAVALLLPFVFSLQLPIEHGLPLLVGAVASVHHSDVISGILLGIPGSPGAAATVLDGHEMAKQGKAAHALSLAFLCSMAGGVLGAVGLTFTIPIARPLVLTFGSPEIFMLSVLGVSLTALVSKGNILKGVVAAALGMIFGIVGTAPSVATYRFTFGSTFLNPGLALGSVALGIFGIAEVAGLVASRKAVGGGLALQGRWLDGVSDFLRNWKLVIRGALVGIWAGVLPGVGATAGAFMAYGQTVATAKDRSRFGKGDPRGLVGPESAANACESGDLVPTLMFGVPGGAPAALLMGALLYYSIEPGPRLITDHLDTTYTIVWAMAIGSVIASLLCFPLAGPLAKLTSVPLHRLAPGLVLIMLVGAFQATASYGELLVVVCFGIFGLLMKRADFPRAPLLIGFVLSKPLERYYFLTVNLYSTKQWVLRPAVLVMFAILLAPIVVALVRMLRRRAKRTAEPPTAEPAASVQSGSAAGTPEPPTGGGGAGAGVPAMAGTGVAVADADVRTVPDEPEPVRSDHHWSVGFTVLAAVMLVTAFVLSLGYNADARLAPRLISVIGICAVLLLLAVEVNKLRAARRSLPAEPKGSQQRWIRSTVTAVLWIASVPVLTLLLGFTIAAVVFVIAFLWRVSRMKPLGIAIYALAVLGLLYVVTTQAGFQLPDGYLFLGSPWAIL
ncbi:MAG: tripartite tricarboxylate transporter permease [Actinoallomurus sp.]